MHKFIYGSTAITPPEIIKSEEPSDKERELARREADFTQQQLSNAVSDVTVRTDNVIKSTIDKYIDMKQVMTSYVRNKATDDVMNQVRESISGDSRFRAMLDKMWEASAKEGFNETSKLKIRNALISKAKTILPGIIQKVKNDALKGSLTRTKEASETKDERPLPRGKPAEGSKKLDKNSIPKGMRSIDYLMQD